MDRDEVLSRFQTAVADVLEAEPADITLEKRWAEDLDADSLAIVECTLALNDEFGITIPDIESDDVRTVADAFDIVMTLVP
jgi:acyl carrier protein